MAVRSALGASRAQLIRQIVVEQAVLAVLGGVAGIVVARLALPALVSRIPAEVPRVGQIALDWSVLATVLGASVGVAVAVALIPAVLTARPSLQPLLRQSRTTDTPTRRRALGLTIFAGAGLLLGLVGVYGVVAYRVRQREREIGIRLALGAEPSRMANGEMAQGLVHAVIGLAIGLPAAFLLSRVMASVVFGVTPRDPLTFATLPVGILVITAAACYLPSRRASRLDPVVALRQD